MCYYKTAKIPGTKQIQLNYLEKDLDDHKIPFKQLEIGFDYAPSPVLKPAAGKEDFDIVAMEWGFIPNFLHNRVAVEKFRKGYKDEKGVFQMPITTLNAKAENLFTNEKGRKSMWADSAGSRRCLALAAGFFEWRHVYGINKKTGQPLKTAKKYPYFISLKDRPYFYMAAIWNEWVDQETGETVDTFAIITTEANSLMRQIHNSKMRMPTILPDDLAFKWMFGSLTNEEISALAATQIPSAKMQAYTVVKDFTIAEDPMEREEYEVPGLEV